MERSFARATRYGFDRARWRGLWRVQIQEYLVSTIQNIQVLLRYGRDQTKRLAVALPSATDVRSSTPWPRLGRRAVVSFHAEWVWPASSPR